MATFFVLAVLSSVVLCVTLYALVVRPVPVLQPIPAGPFAPGSGDPVADTLNGQAEVQTVLANEWNAVTLNKLHEVEDLLDFLEAHQVSEREVHTLGNAVFCVRWR
jgi:hypothetical protein